MEDAQLARAVGDSQYTPATDKGYTHVVAEGVQDSTDNTQVGFRVLLAMDHCNGGFRCIPENHTARLIVATVDEKSIEQTMVGGLDGTYVPGEVHVGSNSRRGDMWVHRKGGNVPKGEDPW